MSGTIARMGSW